MSRAIARRERVARARFSSSSRNQQFDVDPDAFGALLFEEIRDIGAGHQVDGDVLAVRPPAVADFSNTVRPNQREAFREHAGRGVEFAEPLHALGGEAGLLLQLLDRGRFGRRAGIVVANQAGGKLDAAAASGTRGWSTRITLPSCSARMTTARMPPVRLAYSHLPRRTARTNLPSHITSAGGRSSRFTVRSACREFRCVALRTREMLGKHSRQPARSQRRSRHRPGPASPRPAMPPWLRPMFPESLP